MILLLEKCNINCAAYVLHYLPQHRAGLGPGKAKTTVLCTSFYIYAYTVLSFLKLFSHMAL